MMWLKNTFAKKSWGKSQRAEQAVNNAKTLQALSSNGVDLSMLELMSYTSKTALINLAATKKLHSKLSGNYLSRSKGRGMEFDEVRHYQNGDDIRAIDWRVTAKTGITHTKLFKEEVERPVLIATDLSANMLFGSQLLFKSVQAAHLASLVAWHAQKRGDRIGGIVFNEHEHSELKPRSRKQAVLHYLYQLNQSHEKSMTRFLKNISIDNVSANNTSSQSTNNSKAENNNNTATLNSTALENNCARLRQLAKPGSLVYLITDGYHLTAEAIRHLTHISKHCELVVCLIHDPLELALPQSNERQGVSITDGKNTQQFVLGDAKLAKQYHDKAMNEKKNKEQLLHKAGARVINISAADSIENQLKSGARI